MAKLIPEKWLCDSVLAEKSWSYDEDRNRVAVTEEVANVAVTNIRKTISDGNGGKIFTDSLLLICDVRTQWADGTCFVPEVDMGITWNSTKYTVQSVVPFKVKGEIHHYEATLV